MKLHELINTRRKERNISVVQIAEYVGVETAAVYFWCSGKGTPSLNNIILLAELFDFTLKDITADKVPKKMSPNLHQLRKLRKIKRLKDEISALEAQT